MANRNELKWGAILSYAQMILNVVIGLTYSRYMIRILGQSEYGLYQTVASTISMLSILNLGFNSSYVRYYAKYKKNNDCGGIYRLNGLFLLIFGAIGLIALACGIYLTKNLQIVFDTGLTSSEYVLARELMILLTINLSISFPMTVFRTIISANERFIFLKLLGMLETVVGPLVNIPLLLMGFRSIGLVVSSLIFNLIMDIIYIYYVIVKLENKFYFSKFEKGLFSSLFTYTIFIAINLVVDQINNSIDKVLLGRFIGTTSVAVYSVGMSLYMYYTTISTSISGVFTPRIHAIYNASDDVNQRGRNISELFIRVGRIQFLILMLFASGLVFFGKKFINFWVGEGYDESYYVLLLIMIPATIPLIQNLGIEIQRAANKHQVRSIIYLGMAICNLILTIYLCKIYGPIGAAFGTGASLILANGIIMNLYYYKALHMDISGFWKAIIRQLLGMLPAFGVGAMINRYAPTESVISMLVFIIIYTLCYAACVWFLSMNNYEKNIVLEPVRKVINRNFKEKTHD